MFSALYILLLIPIAIFAIVLVLFLQFFSTLLHEIGHTITALVLGIPIEYVQIGSRKHPVIFKCGRFRISLPHRRGSIGHTQHTPVFTDTWRYECYALSGAVVTIFMSFLLGTITVFQLIQHGWVTAFFLGIFSALLVLNFGSLRAIPGRDGHHAKFLRHLRTQGYNTIRYVTDTDFAYAETPSMEKIKLGANTDD